MTLHLTEPERSILLEMIDSAHREKLRELAHTDSTAYKNLLRERIRLVEGLSVKLLAAEPVS